MFKRICRIELGLLKSTTKIYCFILNKIDLLNAELLFFPDFWENDEATFLFDLLKKELDWQQSAIKIFGKNVHEPRLTAWYGDEGKIYTYSGKTQIPNAWHTILLSIKNKIEKHSGRSEIFNSVLCNFYRDGKDSMGWHSDDEKELGINPMIASVNFGETRRFLLRHKKDKTLKHELSLTHGSLLLMFGTMQHFWQHAIPKEPKKNQPRINLTFRKII